MNWELLTQKKAQLEKHKPYSANLQKQFTDWFRVETVYADNAIENNMLTWDDVETLIEKGLTAPSKPFNDHLAVRNGANAYNWIVTQNSRTAHSLTLEDLLRLHSILLNGTNTSNSGQFRTIELEWSNNRIKMPSPQKIPDLMDTFLAWLQTRNRLHPIEFAAEAHFRFISICPFSNYNGRVARSLMNMILLMADYPVAIFQKRDHSKYKTTVQDAQKTGQFGEYNKILFNAMDSSLNVYLEALEGERTASVKPQKLMKIGKFAKSVGETNSTIRYWMKEGLLSATETLPSGYQLFAENLVERAERIQSLKADRYSLSDIKTILSKDSKP